MLVMGGGDIMRMSGCLNMFGLGMVILGVIVLCIGGIEATDWFSRTSGAAGLIGMSDVAVSRAVNHVVQYAFIAIPMIVVGWFAMRSHRRREEDRQRRKDNE